MYQFNSAEDTDLKIFDDVNISRENFMWNFGGFVVYFFFKKATCLFCFSF